ncbi:MAG: hypothetical protein WC656_01570 [Sulfurimonas sp.]
MKTNFLKLLAAYAPTSQNKASYDEHVSTYAKKLGIDEINIDNGLFKKLHDIFISQPKSIIISGSAGDGKTYLLRKLYETLNGDSIKWGKDYIPEITYNDFQIKFIKDFTELEKKDKVAALEGLYKSIYEKSNELYIIAANDGILTDTLREHLKKNEHLGELLTLIEEHIENPSMENDLLLLDLSQTSSTKNFELLLNEILANCDRYESDCPSLTDETVFCPIHSNIHLLKQKHIQKQLLAIIRSCDLNYNHITLRKLFMLIANMILGYKGEKKIFNGCDVAIEYYRTPNKKSDASFYNNIFADNLSTSKQEQSPFKELRELRIGYETTNNIDNFILFGDIQTAALYTKELSNPFFDFSAFNGIKENYLNESENESGIEIQKYLVFLRRHLFFNYQEEIHWNNITINSKDLITYEHAETFYADVVVPLKKDLKVSKHIIKDLALGLNRVFLGELLSKDGNDKLYIATSLTGTMSKLSSEVLSSIAFNQKHINQGIHLRLLRGFDDDYCKVNLEIEFEGNSIAKLELDLHMFEFLERIADGILPTSFSVEYYERVLTFKSQIVNYILQNQELDSSFNLFTMNDSEGILQFDEIQVGDGYVREG